MSPIAVWSLIVFLVLDGLDGSLAAYQDVKSVKGKFVDTVCDYFGLAYTTFVLVYAKYVSVFAGFLYLYVSTMLLVLAVVYKEYHEGSKTLIRTRAGGIGHIFKGTVFVLLMLHLFFKVAFVKIVLNEILLVFSAIMLVFALVFYVKILKWKLK